MDIAVRPIIPPAPKVHAGLLPGWRLLFEMSRNTLSGWSDFAFETLVGRRSFFGRDTVLMNDPEGVRHVLSAAAASYVRPPAALRILRPMAGKGVFLAEGTEWRRQRRMLAASFTPASVNLLLPHFFESAAGLMRQLDAKAQVNLSAAFQDATLEAVLRALFSMPDPAQRAKLAALVRTYIDGPGRPGALDGLARSEESFPWATFARRRFERSWHEAVGEVVAERRRSGAEGQKRDLLDLLLAARDPETGAALSDAEIRDQCATMLIAGFETTARLLFWASYLLCLDPSEQERLRQEVLAFTPDRVTRLDDLRHWPLLRQTLFEALRLYPPVAHITRNAIADDMVAGEAISPGTQVWISPWVIHRHRKFWEHPTAFMPARFKDQASPWASGSPFLPFGAGPRICIGAAFALAEAPILLASVLARYRLNLPEQKPVIPVGGVTIAPSFEPLFRLERL